MENLPNEIELYIKSFLNYRCEFCENKIDTESKNKNYCSVKCYLKSFYPSIYLDIILFHFILKFFDIQIIIFTEIIKIIFVDYNIDSIVSSYHECKYIYYYILFIPSLILNLLPSFIRKLRKS